VGPKGSRKSYREDLGGTLNTKQLVADAVEFTNLLRARFHQEKIYLIGHSWGSYLGMVVISRHSELYRAYVALDNSHDSRQLLPFRTTTSAAAHCGWEIRRRSKNSMRRERT
jgi:pimeloyl-ACP methyl ester carboxylesterase